MIAYTMNNAGRLTVERTDVEVPFARERSVVDFIRAQACAEPHASAVKDTERVMSYQELESKSDLVAHKLQRRGIHLEEPVVVMLPASAEFVIALVGILKAGGAYLPVDPDAPLKRVEYILADSQSRFALTNATGLARMPAWEGMALDVSSVINDTTADLQSFSRVSSDPNRRAYVVYTSGSSGQPKGVEIEHHSLTNLVCAYHERFQFAAGDRGTMFSNVAFDACVADVWPMLCAGGSVNVPPRELLQHPDNLIAWLATEQINFTFIPTGMAEILFTRNWPRQMPLRFLVTGGDRLQRRPPSDLPFAVLNAYGPTENTVISTWCVLRPQNGETTLPAIGRPIANVKSYVLDEHGQPVADGVAGELYLGGEQIARGYLGKTLLTAGSFVPDPFTGRHDDRMYRTGDWVRRSAEGELDFLGRRDDQVQIRGSRVELGEIETLLLTHSQVRQVCCLPHLENDLATGIVAHVVANKNGSDLSNHLRSHLAARLPVYMLPSEFVFHEFLPLTAHGKVDRRALSNSVLPKTAPDLAQETGDGLEKALGRVWHSLLPAAGNSPKDATFASLGGDSLLLMRLLLSVEELTNQRVEISSFLVEPTFPGLCQAVKTRMSQTEFQPVLALRRQGNRPPLFCLYNFEGDIDIYFALAEALGDDQPVFGIRSPALENLSRLPDSMETAAAEVLQSIRKVQPHGTPALIGYSWAGLLAFEAARQLARDEGVFCFTALIGADAPVRPSSKSLRLAHFTRHFCPWLWHLLTDAENRRRRLLNWKKMISGTKNITDLQLPMSGWVSTPISQHMVGLMEKYGPRVIDGLQVDLFRERDSYNPLAHPLHAWQISHLQDGGWNYWTRKPARVHWLDGDHKTIVRPPAVNGLAQSIRAAMDEHITAVDGFENPNSKKKWI